MNNEYSIDTMICDGDHFSVVSKVTGDTFKFRCIEIDTERYFYDTSRVGQRYFDLNKMNERFTLDQIYWNLEEVPNE